MSIKTTIKDGAGRGNEAHVENDGSVAVSNTGIPPEHPHGSVRLFRQYLTDNGLIGGSNDMRVVGTTAAPLDFYIKAATDADRYIDSISFVIADAGATFKDFGAITALINGVEIFYEDPVLGNVTIHESLKSNFDFIRLCNGNPAFGTAADAFRGKNVIGLSEGYFPTLDFSEVFGIPWGIRIPKGTTLRLVIRIKDDTTLVDQFDAIAYGYDRIID